MNAREVLRAVPAILGLLALSASTPAQTVDLEVVASDGSTVGGYRWLLEEDRTYQVEPGIPAADPLSFGFHTSYMPIAGKGRASGPATLTVDPTRTYYVSVLPDAGFTLSGARILPGQSRVTVVVHPEPIPTARISVLAFRDDAPINGAVDLPGEPGLAGFSVILHDAIGGGQVLQDAFGNPLGTTYNPDGTVQILGNGRILTDVNGEALIENLYPGKYGVQIVPPAGQDWIQTTTIEGTKTVDAWVKAGEPPFFVEFGPPGYHVAIGFVRPMRDAAFLSGPGTLTGRVVNLHLSRPPVFTFSEGQPFTHTTPWIGLNDLATGLGRGVYAAPANSDGTFTIDGVPEGTHQLVVWDEHLDLIISQSLVFVPPGGGLVDLGDVGVFQWFGRLESHVFFDANENGFRDPGEPGMLEQNVNLRFRDGTIYQALPTDLDGFAPFDEVFPFFHWIVPEIDFARYKATGVTVTVDAGGPVDPADPFSHGGVLNPQPQPDNGMLPYRTETGPVLTEAMQLFLGQTNVLEWGKTNYGPGENGGISGIVYYAVTRAEDDPAYAVAEPWEPGIPRVVVNLYQDTDADGVIDDLDGDGLPTLADADNYPFGNFPAPEDLDRNGNGVFDPGDALQTTTTDSWDDSPPTGLPGDPNDPFYLGGKGYDGLRAWNQVRPGVFDGGYIFDSYVPGGIASGAAEVQGLPVGTYIVEAVPPRSESGAETYVVVAEEHKNVDFGDTYAPANLQQTPPPLVGDPHLVPAELTLFPGIPAPFAGQMRPLGDRKQVTVQDAQNTACDFFFCTEVPVAAHVVGFVLNDLANEFDPNAPTFGEKAAPSWIPVTFRDWAGNVVSRVYTDRYGKYNAILPSTFSKNLPSPSGVAPNMLTVTINDAGPIPDPANPGAFIIDPFYDPQFSQFTYTFQFMPGATTYLDTPVVPIAAFAGPGQFPLDCQPPDGQPSLYEVRGPLGGPYVSGSGETLLIRSVGTIAVDNPAYDGLGGVQPKTITRDYGFGSVPGSVTVDGTPLDILAWAPDAITASVPPGVETGQLHVTRGDNGLRTDVGVTLTVGPYPGAVTVVLPDATPGATPIQDAIDAASPGDLILVQPGLYEESVILWKPLFLQGAGEHSTLIKAIQAPSEKLTVWRDRVRQLALDGLVDLLPAQGLAFGGLEPETLATEEGAGILVLAKDTPPDQGGFGTVGGRPNARIDGFTFVGASLGGGIVVNGYAHALEISNNRVSGNSGAFGGGIRSGHPFLMTQDAAGNAIVQPCFNDHLSIHNNRVLANGGLGGAGGGISLYTGTDAYRVVDNVVCGNFTTGEGGGIGHLGKSDGGRIASNRIRFNQSFNQMVSVSGGGILVSGTDPIAGVGVSEGSGSVAIDGNVIQGNQAGAGDGGGIRLSRVNGSDLGGTPFTVDVVDNEIVDNVAGMAGGGISIQDAIAVRIVNNTIANNDSTATAGNAFPPGSPSASVPQPSGVVSHVHSNGFADALPAGAEFDAQRLFSNPLLANNVIWHNRSFHFEIDPTGTVFGLVPDVTVDPPVYWDLAVAENDAELRLDPRYCLLSDPTGYDPSNVAGDPLLTAEYSNGDRGQTVLMPEMTSTLQTAAAFDEGGNFLDVKFGPLTPRNPATGALFSDIHLQAGSAAIGAGSSAFLAGIPDAAVDPDGDPRTSIVDIGADQASGGGLLLSLAPIAPGPNTLTLAGGTDGSLVLFLYGFQAGPLLVTPGICPDGLTLGFLDPSFLGLARVAGSAATLDVEVPATFTGSVLLQAVEIRTCQTSNVLFASF